MMLRSPCENDFDFYYNLKCEPSSVYWSGFEKEPDRENLKAHFHKLITGGFPERTLYILEDEKMPVGYIQLTRNNPSEIEIGYGVSERFRGNGYGVQLLLEAKKIVAGATGDIRLIGYVRDDNYASKRCFEKAGFLSRDAYVERYFAKDQSEKKMYLYEWNK